MNNIADLWHDLVDQYPPFIKIFKSATDFEKFIKKTPNKNITKKYKTVAKGSLVIVSRIAEQESNN